MGTHYRCIIIIIINTKICVVIRTLHIRCIIHYTRHQHKQLGGWELPSQDGEEGGSFLARMGRRVGAS